MVLKQPPDHLAHTSLPPSHVSQNTPFYSARDRTEVIALTAAIPELTT